MTLGPYYYFLLLPYYYYFYFHWKSLHIKVYAPKSETFTGCCPIMTLTSKGTGIEDSRVAGFFGSYYFHKIDENGNDVYRSPKGNYIYFKLEGYWAVSTYFRMKCTIRNNIYQCNTLHLTYLL